ncbi:MAG: putative quinol monooxygenase [Pseudonocardiaceae bacterium]
MSHVIEGFDSSEADEAHLNSEHFQTAMAWIPDVIVKAPEIVKVEVPQDGWHQISELAPR